MGKLILVRHGESVGNRERIFTTTPVELALTDIGREQARQAAEGEAEIRQATLDYWRRMRQRGVAIYAQEAPHWVRSVLELEPALEPALGEAVVSG